MVLDGRQHEAKNNDVLEKKIMLLGMQDPCDDCTHWVGKI
jgi:hypothetical protein